MTTPNRADERRVETWTTVEIELAAALDHDNPMAVDVDAIFTAEGGESIRRPAFWDGGRTWRVRFAPTVAGAWTMTTTSSEPDAGLESVAASIRAVPYEGELEIYRRGFLRVAKSGRHFEYADGVPFFYLGDTHWVLPHERFDTSNAPGVDSQFLYLVDKRVAQGFTVYQSEPIWQPHEPTIEHPDRADEEAVANLTNGFDASDLAGFANLDRKFRYIADKGLVHANAQISWVLDPADHPDVMDDRFMRRMARYWVARYGSYPVMWTIGQEIDPSMYGRFPIDGTGPWFAVAREIEATDAYAHVIMPHMENTSTAIPSTSSWASYSFHHAFGAQMDRWNTSVTRAFWECEHPKPSVVYETRYDGFWATNEEALAAGYNAFQSGIFGYGYGATGVWNDVYSRPGERLDAGTDYELPEHYGWWFDGAELPTGERLSYLRTFYEGLPWWKLEPRFDDPAWSLLAGGDFIATIGTETFVVVLNSPSALTSNGVIRGLDDAPYDASWFDPRTGVTMAFASAFVTKTGEWRLPRTPSAEFWVLLVQRSA